MRDSKLWISLVIVAVIGLHALPVISYQGARQTRWPFLAWAMYAKAYPPGPIEATRRRLVATTSTGREEEVTPGLVGLPRPTLRTLYLTPLARGDSARAIELLGRLNQGRDDPFVRLRLEGARFTLTDSGVVVAEEFPVVTYRANEPGQESGQ